MALVRCCFLNLILFLSLFLLSTIHETTSMPHYLDFNCPNSTFARNSKFKANLNALLTNLSSVANTHPLPPGGFYTTAIANTTNDAVYGLFLCRGDQNITGCGECVKKAATSGLQTHCPNSRSAVIYYDECTVRYSNESLLGKMSDEPFSDFMNAKRFNGNQTLFFRTMWRTMNGLVAETASNRSSKKYTTKMVNITNSVTLYAMEQCTPDLTPSDCSKCLRKGIGLLETMQGARILMPSCHVRYETYPFYIGAVNYSLPLLNAPPASDNFTVTADKGSRTNITIMNNCDNIVWPAILPSDGLINATSGFALSKGDYKIINIQPGWVGSVWGRTLCSHNNNNYFSCQTGDCGGVTVECLGDNVKAGPKTQAKFIIGLSSGDSDSYSLSLESGYNLPMMVAPQGGTRAMCRVADCTFKLNHNRCPSNLSVIGGESGQSIIACQNPCFYLSQLYCNFSVTEDSTCQLYKYCDASSTFGLYCPKAHMEEKDQSSTTFSCKRNNYQTSYNITFCPSSDMIKQFSKPFQESLAAPPSGNSKASIIIKLCFAIGVPTAVLVMLISSCTYHFRKKTKKSSSLDLRNGDQEFTTAESLMFELGTLQTATNYFSDESKLGGGGFGNVYKGTLPSGQEIAVKRLTRLSDHGLEAFKNEAILIAKLQHKNLVRLLGFCSTREERLLVYEYVPNKSLDYLLFEPRKQGDLDWPTRYNIVTGITRGLLYLHEDSRPRIIHRDLKAPNILLEADMNPKISDFGLARIFNLEQAEDATNVIAGTYGYMAPEYAMHGQFSIKSDAYSFGVLLLEIISGKKIHSRFPVFGDGDLLTYAWRCWKDERPLEFLDPTLGDSYSTEEVLRCIHLGLLCVQENSHERPTMSTIVFMLNTDSNTNTLSKPQCPRSFYRSNTDSSQAASSNQHLTTTTTDTISLDDPNPYTRNQLTVSEMSPR